MLKNLTKLKNIICKIVLVLGVLFLALCTRVNFTTTKTVLALNKQDVSDDMLSSHNFYSTSSNYITSNSNWTTITPSDETNADSFKKGIVNVEKIDQTIKDDETATDNKTDGTIVNNLWDNYGLFTSPGKVSNITIDEEEDKGVNNYLMINAHNFSGHIGYESDDFTLEKGSYYKIAITLKTINDSADIEVKDNEEDELTTEHRTSDAKASIYLDGISDTKAITSYELISTNNSWSTYYFYISTSSFESESNLTLQLYLGSKENSSQGAVFFSNVKIEEYSESEYNKEVTEDLATKDNVNVISLNNNYVYDFVSNSSFESNLDNWTTIGSANGGDIFSTIIDTTTSGYLKGNSKYPAIPSNNNTSVNNINALAIYSNPNENGSTYYGVESSKFSIKQYGLYRISLWAYSNSGSENGAYITLYDVDNTDKKVQTKISTSATTSSTSLNNNWTEYEFYIQGNALRDSNLKLQFTIGTSEEKDDTLNYAMFDDIRIQEINYTQFSSGKSDTNTLSLTTDLSSGYLISNYTFDLVENTETSFTKPLNPSNWTLEGSGEQVFAGVVNTNTTTFANNSSYYGNINNLINPGKISPSYPIDSNNVLMMGTNQKNKSISFKTASTFSLSSNSYYKLSFDVFTQNLSESNKGANFVVTDSNGATLLAIENIQTNNAWTNYTYYLSTNMFSKTCNVTLSLNNVDAYAYFDNIELTSIESDLYSELKENTSLNFVEIGTNLLANEESWTTTDNTDTATTGFINAEDHEISVDDKEIAFVLSDTKDVEYYLTSKDSINLSTDSFYKISVYVNTRDIKKLNADDNTEYGASFFIKSSDELYGFNNINTDATEFEKYIIYVTTGTNTNCNVLLGLGSEDNKVSGIAYFTNLEIVKFDSKTHMESDKALNTNIKTTDVELLTSSDDGSSDSDNDSSLTIYTPNWLAISSLVTSAAMIIAILAFFIRKINFKKKKKKVSTNYDRRQTLDKRYDLKERIAYREELIEGLNSELKSIKETTDEVVKEHNEKLNAIKSATDDSSDALKKKLDDLYKKKLEISKEHNKIIAQDKLNASKEEDIAYNEKIQAIEKEEKTLNSKIKSIEKSYNKEKDKLDDLVTRSENRQKEINAEITSIKKEIEEINNELTNLNNPKK